MSTTTAPAADPSTEEEPKKKGRTKLIAIVLVLALAGAAAYWFLLRGPAEPTEPVPGEVLTLEPVQVNLSGGHYLRIGIALQLTEEAHEADGSKALDATIEMFSGLAMEDISDQKERTKLKSELEKELDHDYHGEVIGVYFTEFVTQ